MPLLIRQIPNHLLQKNIYDISSKVSAGVILLYVAILLFTTPSILIFTILLIPSRPYLSHLTISRNDFILPVSISLIVDPLTTPVDPFTTLSISSDHFSGLHSVISYLRFAKNGQIWKIYPPPAPKLIWTTKGWNWTELNLEYLKLNRKYRIRLIVEPIINLE